MPAGIQRTITTCVAVILVGYSVSGWSNEYQSESLGVRHQTIVDFDWIDSLKSPKITRNASQEEPKESEGPRTLGLTRFESRFELLHGSGAALRFTLRPDATLSRSPKAEPSVELDRSTWSESSFRKPRQIYLLDSYEISVGPAQGFEAAVGVWPELYGDVDIYPELLEFDLGIEGPRVVSGLKLSWFKLHLMAPTTVQIVTPAERYAIYVYQGDGDRSETYGSKEESLDQSPVATDPYISLAGRFRVSRNSWSFDALAVHDNSAVEGGRLNQLTLASTMVWWLGGERLSSLCFDLRGKKDAWHTDGPSKPNLTHMSSSALWRKNFYDSYEFGAGFRYGEIETLEVDPSKVYKIAGYQGEISLAAFVFQGMKTTLMVAEESRDFSPSKEPNKSGFGEDAPRSIRRFVLNLSYRLGSEGTR